jgi:hypothetical protein
MTETASPEPQRLAYIVTGDASNPSSRVSFVLNSRWRSYALGSDQGQKIVELLRATPQDIDTIAELADIPTWIAKQTHGRVTVDELERLRLDGKLIDYGLTGRITKIVEQGASFAALANFIENVSENPSPSVAEDLYRFLEKGDIPITPEGMILCFKRVDTTTAPSTPARKTSPSVIPTGGPRSSRAASRIRWAARSRWTAISATRCGSGSARWASTRARSST